MFNEKMKKVRRGIKALRLAERAYRAAYERVFYDELCGIRYVYPTAADEEYLEEQSVPRQMKKHGYTDEEIMVYAIIAFDIEIARHNRQAYSSVVGIGYSPYKTCSDEEHKKLSAKYSRHTFRPYGRKGM